MSHCSSTSFSVLCFFSYWNSVLWIGGKNFVKIGQHWHLQHLSAIATNIKSIGRMKVISTQDTNTLDFLQCSSLKNSSLNLPFRKKSKKLLAIISSKLANCPSIYDMYIRLTTFWPKETLNTSFERYRAPCQHKIACRWLRSFASKCCKIGGFQVIVVSCKSTATPIPTCMFNYHVLELSNEVL